MAADIHLGIYRCRRPVAERAVRRSMAISAHHRHSRLGQARLRTNDVDDALLGAAQGYSGTPEFPDSCAQSLDLRD